MIVGFVTSLIACTYLLQRQTEEGNALNERSLQSGCFKGNWPLVLLGGGMKSDHELSRFSLARVDGAVKFLLSQRLNIQTVLIVSGGPVKSKEGSTEAALMKAKLLDQIKPLKNLKVEIWEEARSLSTQQNAEYVGQLLDSKQMRRRAILLTGIFHIKRATKTFQNWNFEVCPAVIARQEELLPYL